MKKQWLAICCLAGAVLTGCSREDDAGSSYAYDRNFMKMAAYSNRNILEIGVLLKARSSDSVLLAYAGEEVTTHETAYNELLGIANNYPQSIPVAPDAKHSELRQQMLTLAGRSFDSVYIHAQVADHQAALKLFNDELTYGIDPVVKAYASKYLPVIQSHLGTALDIAATY